MSTPYNHLTRISKFLFFLCLLIKTVHAQELKINPELLSKTWASSWITCPDVPQRDYGIYHFRKKIVLTNKPGKFIIHVTADNRYRLFVNGRSVCNGPARGDLYNWYFETVDIAPFLKTGENIIAALVWNMGTDAPVAQVSNQTGLVIQGDGENEQLINTNSSWKVTRNTAYTPCSLDNGPRLRTYMVIGPGDDVEGSKYPWGWELIAFDDSEWAGARQISNPVTAGYGTDNLWTLKPRNIPMMEEKLQRMHSVRRMGETGKLSPDSRSTGAAANLLKGTGTLQVAANSKISLLIDQSYNTVAYPEIIMSGGGGSVVRLTYAESLFKNRVKGNRDSIDGKEIMGNYDIFRPDGGSNRLFRPLWLRTYRYMQLDITTANDPLVIDDIYGMYTGYPFQEEATFTSNDTSLADIWNVGWRTARLCAGETYYDCPYYEQLQYEGDTRIQSLISLYVSGDDRLMRKALLDFFHSRVPEGLTQGRYPSNRLQVIPPFSLYWVSMIYDYWQHRPDTAFLKQFLVGVQGVLDWYEKHIDKNNMLGPMKWWNFTDWNQAFPNGVPDGATDGNSSILSMQYAYTLRQAAAVFNYFGKKDEASHYNDVADKLCAATYKACFDAAGSRMANTPQKNSFSQHAGIMAVLTGTVPTENMKTVMTTVLNDSSLSQATFYYRFYLTLALKKAGLANMYYDQLLPWRNMLAVGLTTFAENPDPTRSDCHAWSASPNYDFLATICGIMPDAPGFTRVLIEPAFGELTNISGSMPHPAGTIKVQLERKDKAVQGTITLPAGVSGHFRWNGKEIAVNPGVQTVAME